MKKSDRNELRKLRRLPTEKRTTAQIRRLIELAKRDQDEARVLDPIRPQPKRKP